MATLIERNNLIGGSRKRDERGTLQLFCQSADTVKVYSTGLSGTYNLKLINSVLIHSGVATLEFAFQIISDTFRLAYGNTNNNIKLVHERETGMIPTPIPLYQVDIKNHVAVDFQQLGSVGTDINTVTYNIVLTFEYEKL
jgi:hypothetical protein